MRGRRGWSGGSVMHAFQYSCGYAADERYDHGFGVAEVPEPVTLSLLALGGLAVLRRRKK